MRENDRSVRGKLLEKVECEFLKFSSGGGGGGIYQHSYTVSLCELTIF